MRTSQVDLSATLDLATLKADRNRLAQELRSAGATVRGNAFTCPFHDDQKASGSLFERDGGWYAKCHGCGFCGDVIDVVRRAYSLEFTEAVQRLGIPNQKTPRPKINQPYSSREAVEAAVLAMFPGGSFRSFLYSDHQAVVRIDFKDGRDKEIRPIHCDGGAWFIGKGKRPWPLYREAEALQHERIYVAEGEGVADAGWNIGLPCVTWQGGCANVKNADFAPIVNGPLVLLPDNDPGGRRAMEHIAALGTNVKLIELPDLPPGGDLVDFVRQYPDKTAEELRAVIEGLVNLAPQWTSPNAVGAQQAPAAEDGWPEPIDDAAFYGLAGDVVRAIEPHSEADPVALLIQFLVAFGNAVGRAAHFIADGAEHCLNLFAVLTGQSSKSRKGTSWSRIIRLFDSVEQAWAGERCMTGLSSGEGLIWQCRDPIVKSERDKKTKEYEQIIIDPGVSDKRLLVQEPEFANVLRVCQREGNTLSAIIRLAWERGDLRALTKNSPAQATGAHISIIGHIVADELRRYLDRSEIAGGFGNRFLWLMVKRSKCLPDGGSLHQVDFGPILQRLSAAIAFGRQPRELRRDERARAVWHEAYPDLSEGKPGLTGALIARGEAQVMRLASIYALLDSSALVRVEHLCAALAVQEYVERSVYYVFGHSLGDPIADEIYAALRAAPDGMTRTEIRDLFQRHVSGERVGRALELLVRSKLARSASSYATGGRPAERWYASRGEGLLSHKSLMSQGG